MEGRSRPGECWCFLSIVLDVGSDERRWIGLGELSSPEEEDDVIGVIGRLSDSLVSSSSSAAAPGAVRDNGEGCAAHIFVVVGTCSISLSACESVVVGQETCLAR